MKPAEVLDIIRDVVNKAGVDGTITVGLDKNEEADFMWYSCKGKEDFFVVSETRNLGLFVCPFSWIENATYSYIKDWDVEDIIFTLNFNICFTYCQHITRDFYIYKRTVDNNEI